MVPFDPGVAFESLIKISTYLVCIRYLVCIISNTFAAIILLLIMVIH